MKTSLAVMFVTLPIAAMMCGCTPQKPDVEALRPVRTVALQYDQAAELSRYFGSVQSRHEVDQGFRVAGKVAQRRVEVGQTVREDDVLAVLDDNDYRLAEEAASQQLAAATSQARQAQADRRRLDALKTDGSVSPADDEHAQSRALESHAAAEAAARQLELARNRLKYTILRASQSGVVTAVRFEVGQVLPEGQPVVTIANPGEPEIVVDIPEADLASFKLGRFKASLPSVSQESFDVALRELSPQAAAQTRTYRARMKPAPALRLPLGATATLTVEGSASTSAVAPLPAAAITQSDGKPAVWIVHRAQDEAAGTVQLMPVAVHEYRSDEVLVSGPPAGELIVTAGVQKMRPGLRVALPEETLKEAAR